MTRVVEGFVFGLGFFAVFVAVAFRVAADVDLGPDHDTLTHQVVIDAIPADARVLRNVGERAALPFVGRHDRAYDFYTYQTALSSAEQNRRFADLLSSHGWARVFPLGGRGGPPSADEWCRGSVGVTIPSATAGSLPSYGVALFGRRPFGDAPCHTLALTEYFSDTTVAAAAITLPFVVYLAMAQRRRSRGIAVRGVTLTRGGGVAQHAASFAWVPYLVVAMRPLPELELPALVRTVGIVLAVAGVVFAVRAMRTLGRHFDLEPEVHRGHEIVRSGPYGLVRHPIYTGLAIHSIGAMLATGNALFIGGTLLVTFPVFVMRARAEERLLREELGAEYDRYARDVPMLVPRLR